MKKQLLSVTLFIFGCLFAQAQFNGEADSTFASNGALVVDFTNSQNFDILTRAIFGPDGKLYLGGTSYGNPNSNIALASFNQDGTPNTGFGNQGSLTFDPFGDTDIMTDMVLTEDGKIVVFGYVNTGQEDQIVARFNMSDGSLDHSFNNTGFRISGGQTYDDVWATGMVNANGKVMAAGHTEDGEGINLSIARFGSNGLIDLTFGFGGFITFDFGQNEYILDIHQASSNRYYLLANIDAESYVLAIDNNGNLINNFGSNGRQKLDIFPIDGERLQKLTTLPNGNIVLVGFRDDTDGNDNPLVIQLTSTGEFDTSFNGSGYYSADLASGEDDELFDVMALEDGSLLLSGLTERSGEKNFFTMMLAFDGFFDAGYGDLGVQEYPLAPESIEEHGMLCMDPEGDIYVYGSTLITNHSDGVIIKLKTTDTNTSTREQTAALSGLQVFPNPSSGSLTVSYSLEEAKPVQVQLLSLTGQRLAAVQIHQPFTGVHTIDASPLLRNVLPGMYLLSIQAGHSVETQKIILR